jgi:hypothetical protein
MEFRPCYESTREGIGIGLDDGTPRFPSSRRFRWNEAWAPPDFLRLLVDTLPLPGGASTRPCEGRGGRAR